jgi:hypothetical protein
MYVDESCSIVTKKSRFQKRDRTKVIVTGKNRTFFRLIAVKAILNMGNGQKSAP